MDDQTIEQVEQLVVVDDVSVEVGDEVKVEALDVELSATWLGTVSSPRELYEAMQLMGQIVAERKGQG